jgi:hypothetical protein
MGDCLVILAAYARGLTGIADSGRGFHFRDLFSIFSLMAIDAGLIPIFNFAKAH